MLLFAILLSAVALNVFSMPPHPLHTHWTEQIQPLTQNELIFIEASYRAMKDLHLEYIQQPSVGTDEYITSILVNYIIADAMSGPPDGANSQKFIFQWCWGYDIPSCDIKGLAMHPSNNYEQLAKGQLHGGRRQQIYLPEAGEERVMYYSPLYKSKYLCTNTQFYDEDQILPILSNIENFDDNEVILTDCILWPLLILAQGLLTREQKERLIKDSLALQDSGSEFKLYMRYLELEETFFTEWKDMPDGSLIGYGEVEKDGNMNLSHAFFKLPDRACSEKPLPHMSFCIADLNHVCDGHSARSRPKIALWSPPSEVGPPWGLYWKIGLSGLHRRLHEFWSADRQA